MRRDRLERDYDSSRGCGIEDVRLLSSGAPEGPRFNHFVAFPKKVVQTLSLMVVLGEDLTYRQIFLDGRALPEVSAPSYMGYSVGHWEGDTLVVETVGFKDDTYLDFGGHPHSEQLRLTERYRRLDFGHMEIEETFSDPGAYSRPLTVKVSATLVPDTELLEYVCTENEKDLREGHLVGTAAEDVKAVTPVKVDPAVLATYVGAYNFAFPENPTVFSVWPVTMADGQLFLVGGPLVPVSDTKFVWAGGESARIRQGRAGPRHGIRHGMGRRDPVGEAHPGSKVRAGAYSSNKPVNAGPAKYAPLRQTSPTRTARLSLPIEVVASIP
jgi:hypothetical protein